MKPKHRIFPDVHSYLRPGERVVYVFSSERWCSIHRIKQINIRFNNVMTLRQTFSKEFHVDCFCYSNVRIKDENSAQVTLCNLDYQTKLNIQVVTTESDNQRTMIVDKMTANNSLLSLLIR